MRAGGATFGLHSLAGRTMGGTGAGPIFRPGGAGRQGYDCHPTPGSTIGTRLLQCQGTAQPLVYLRQVYRGQCTEAIDHAGRIQV